MSITKLVEYLNQAKCKEIEIVKFSIWLSDPSLLEIKCWNVLAKQFFDRYRPELERWYGKKGVSTSQALVPVSESMLLIEFMAGMKQKGYFPGCTYERLALRLRLCFDLKISAEQLEKMMSRRDSYLFEVFLKSYKEIYPR